MCIYIMSVSEAKGQQDSITGIYVDHPYKKYNNKYQYGSLEVLKVSKDKITFELYSVNGLPAHNEGSVEGVAMLTNYRAFYKDGECEITFLFSKNMVEVRVNKSWACGITGNNVSYEGVYKLKSRKLETLKR